MQINTILSQGAMARGQQQIPIRPTLFIGMGGSGMKVLRQLRRLFVLKYGKVGLPCVRYLWMDTDLEEILDGGSVNELPGVKFSPDEVIDLSMNNADFQEIVGNPFKYKHIHNWIDSNVSGMPNLLAGASQNRQAGRVSFFNKFSEISSRIDNVINTQLLTAATSRQMKDAESEGGMGIANYNSDHLDIILVHSIAGGTGAGCFLDLCFLLRAKLSDHLWDAGTQIISYALLPSVYYENAREEGRPQKTHANAMAALREIEFYSARRDLMERTDELGLRHSRHDFRVNWMGGGSSQRPIIGPPFDIMYLVDRKTDASDLLGTDRSGQLEIFNMIAQRLYMNFSTAGFSTRLRSTTSNMRYKLTEDFTAIYDDDRGRFHTEHFGKRFCGLGLSRLYIPSDEIRRACSAQMSDELISDWLRQRELESSGSEYTEVLFNELNLDYRHMMDRFLSSTDKRWRDHLESLVGQARQDLLRSINGPDKRSLDRRVNYHYAVMRDKLKVLKNQPPQQWGPVANHVIYEGQTRERKATRDHLTRKLKEWSMESHRGIVWSQLALQRVVVDLGPEREELKKRIEKLADGAEKDRRNLGKLMEYLREEQEFRFPRQKAGLRTLLLEIVRNMDNFFKRKLEIMALEQIIEHHLWFAAHVGFSSYKDETTQKQMVGTGLIQQFKELEESLVNMRNEFRRNLEVFDKEEDFLSSTKLYSKGDYLKYYEFKSEPEADPQPIDARILKQLEVSVFADLNNIHCVFELPEVLKTQGTDFILKAIERNTFSWFDTRRNKITFEISDKIRGFGRDKVRALSTQLATWGRPWTKVADVQSSLEKDFFLGVAPNTRHLDNMRLILDGLEGINGNAAVNVIDGEEDSIWVTSEVYGLPACSVRDIAQYRFAYYAQLVTTERHITRHYQVFKDVMYMSDHEAKEHMTAVKLLVNCLLYKVVKVVKTEDEDTGLSRCELMYMDKYNTPPRNNSLLHWDEAIRIVKNDPGTVDKLRRLLEEETTKQSVEQIRAILLAIYYTKTTTKLFGPKIVRLETGESGELKTAEVVSMDRIKDTLLVKAQFEPGMGLNEYVASLSPEQIEGQVQLIEDDIFAIYLPR